MKSTYFQVLTRGAQESKGKLSQLVSKESMVMDYLMSSFKQCDLTNV